MSAEHDLLDINTGGTSILTVDKRGHARIFLQSRWKVLAVHGKIKRISHNGDALEIEIASSPEQDADEYIAAVAENRGDLPTPPDGYELLADESKDDDAWIPRARFWCPKNQWDTFNGDGCFARKSQHIAVPIAIPKEDKYSPIPDAREVVDLINGHEPNEAARQLVELIERMIAEK